MPIFKTNRNTNRDLWRRQFKKLFPDIPIEYFDERFTSTLAHRSMLEGGLKKKDRRNKELVDEISAVIILQGYMESVLHA